MTIFSQFALLVVPEMAETQPEHYYLFLGTKAVSAVSGLSLAFFAGLLFLVPPLTAALSAYLFFTMALITLMDLRHFIIPDRAVASRHSHRAAASAWSRRRATGWRV